MPIYVYLDVDIESCRACATAIEGLGEAAESGFDSFRQARDKSEPVWDSDAGDSFRATISTLAQAAEQTSDRAADLSKALRAFIDSMLTAREHLNPAVARCLGVGIPAGPDVCDATWIADPEPLPPIGPWSIEQQTTYANQVAAYNDAVDMTNAARVVEANAHAALQAAFQDSAGFLDRLRSSAPWMVAGGAISYLGTAAQQADQWAAIAQDRLTQVHRFTAIAAETGPESVTTAAARAVTTFGPAADDAVRAAAQNRALLPGRFLTEVGGPMSTGLPFAGQIGQKIPIAGVALTGLQTAYDLRDADDAGDVAKIVAKDAGGFLAGTAATTLLLGSAAGGPATVAAVGAGVLVAYGVGELIEWVAD